MKFFTPTGLVAAALASAVVVVPFLPVAKGHATLFALEVRLASTAAGHVQVYHDSGAGLSELASARLALDRSDTPVLYRLALPPGTKRGFRFDPIDRDGTVTIESLRVVGPGGRLVRAIALSELKPIQHIQSVAIRDGRLEVGVTPGANDPQFAINFTPPLLLKATWAELTSGFFLRALSVFVLLAVSCLGLDRTPHLKRFLQSVRGFHLTLFFLLAGFFFSFGSYNNCPYKIESDGKYYYQFLISAWFDGDLDFSNNYQTAAPAFMGQPLDHYQFGRSINPVTQRPTNVFGCGLALLWAPFFAAARTAVVVLDLIAPGAIDPNPWSRFHQYFVMFSAVIYACLGLAMIGDTWKKWTGTSCSRSALLLTLFASPLFYYTAFEASMSHAYDFFTLSLVLWLLVRNRGNPSWISFLGLGLACGLHVLVRTQNLLTVGILAATLIPYWQVLPRKTYGGYGLFLIATILGCTPCFLINHYLFGNYWVVPQTASFHVPFLDPWHPKVLPLLFSNRNGFFSHHPWLLAGLVGYGVLAVTAFRKRGQERWILVGLLGAFLGQVYVNSTALDWWAGSSFGQRRLVAMLPMFAFGFAALIEKASAVEPRWWNPVANVLAGIGVVTGVYLTFIHVFLWDYGQPHNIWSWMFIDAPKMWLASRGHL